MNASTVLPNFTEFTQYKSINATTFMVLSLLQIITGSLFNGFVIFMLAINHRLRQVPANVILLSLAISDFFACAVVLPYHVCLVILHINESQMHLTLLLFSMTVSMVGTVILTGDRFLAIVYPLRYNTLVTRTRTRYVLITNWLLSSLYSTIFYLAVHYQIQGIRYLLVLVNFCGVLTILVLYGVIFRAACRQIRRIKSQEGDIRRASVVMFKRTLSSAKTSGSIVFFFAASYLPVYVLAAYNETRSVPISTYNDYVIWLLCLAFLNCSINPLVYCMFSEKLRLTILGYWRRLVARQNTQGVPTQSDMRGASGPL